MANYSKEAERQSKAIQSILDGQEPESRIMVGYEGDKIELTETEKEERKASAERADVLKEARMPWFCPECNKVMKSRLDRKFYYMIQKCHDCVVKEETKMRINGTYGEYEKSKVRENKKSFIKDLKQSIEEWKNSPDSVTYFNQVRPDGYSLDEEKWDVNKDEINILIKEAEEYLEKLEETI
jgi:PHD/YefM family antitoxin component YafN of YafNO toxin-antitoxin module